MTRKELYNIFYDAALPVYGEREAVSVAYFLMDGLYGLSRADVVVGRDDAVVLRDDHDKVLGEISSARPVQYITGRTQFCGLDFVIGEGVLIPRPETEELVEWVASENAGGMPDIIDIGTGSGAIAVSLAARMPEANVTALDLSREALRIAERNARNNGADVCFVHGDILSAEWRDEFLNKGGTFNIIVSNPPYIPVSERKDMEPNVVKHEPPLALFVDDSDPLAFYREIALFGCPALKIGGRIYVEIHEDHAAGIMELFSSMGYSDIEVKKDIHGKDRMVKCVKR